MRFLVSKIGEALRRHPSKHLRLLDKVRVRQVRAKEGTTFVDDINPTYSCNIVEQDEAPINTANKNHSEKLPGTAWKHTNNTGLPKMTGFQCHI